MSVQEILEKTFTINKSIGELEAVTRRLADKVENHSDRILKLEMREEFLQEKMANTAIQAVNEMNSKIYDRLTEIEYVTGIKKLPDLKG